MTARARNALRPIRPTVRVVARTECVFDDGIVRNLFATGFSLTEVNILALRLPPVGTVISMTLYPEGLDPLPSMKAIVVSNQLDPADAHESGFKAIFTKLSDAQIESLCQAAESLGLQSVTPGTRSRGERRKEPRIETNLTAYLKSGDHLINAHVQNLSMSGALIRCNGNDELVEPGESVQLHVVCPSMTEPLVINAKIVRVVQEERSLGVGVHFLDGDEETMLRIEGILLQILSQSDDSSG